MDRAPYFFIVCQFHHTTHTQPHVFLAEKIHPLSRERASVSFQSILLLFGFVSVLYVEKRFLACVDERNLAKRAQRYCFGSGVRTTKSDDHKTPVRRPEGRVV